MSTNDNGKINMKNGEIEFWTNGNFELKPSVQRKPSIKECLVKIFMANVNILTLFRKNRAFSKGRKKFIENKNKIFGKSYQKLRKKLLMIGGLEIILIDEPDLKLLLSKGKIYDYPIKVEKMETSLCHENSAYIWMGNSFRYHYITGYVLNFQDRTWRQHSFIFDSFEKQILETTIKRHKYFGVRLSDNLLEDRFMTLW